MSGLNDQDSYGTTVAIGGLPIAIHSASADFIPMIEARYAGFLAGPVPDAIRFDVDVVPLSGLRTGHDLEEDIEVRLDAGCWRLRRGDFTAEWDPATRRGRVRQAACPYAIDSVMRIVHSLVLAESGGFLLHAASAVRNGRAFLFSGVSEAGKTTIARLAPPDVTLLTDEISYVRPRPDGYQAFGTPFAGELGTPGENIVAPIAAVYFLAKGSKNSIAPLDPASAARRLLRNILFFSDDVRLVERLFQTACAFVSQVQACELTFRPDAEVWSLIR
jgi:hypothetical protein